MGRFSVTGGIIPRSRSDPGEGRPSSSGPGDRGPPGSNIREPSPIMHFRGNEKAVENDARQVRGQPPLVANVGERDGRKTYPSLVREAQTYRINEMPIAASRFEPGTDADQIFDANERQLPDRADSSIASTF